MNSTAMKLKPFLMLVAVFSMFAAPPASALIATHDCSFCHDFHGAISIDGLLKYSSSEVLCLTCHATINGSTDAAAVHNPLNLASNQQGYITCRECHNPHDNIAGNIKLVGYKYDPVTGQSRFTPSIRVELPGSDLGAPVYKTVTFATMTEPADYYRHDGKGACEICHTANHLVGKVCTDCHRHNNDFGGTITPPAGFPVSPSGATCTRCHTGTGTDAEGLYSYNAYNVGPSSPHTKIQATDVTSAACTACHNGHSDAPAVLIPNNSTVGINYSANGETGISLGGTATAGTTEAEICWNCHDLAANGVSEWGVNTDTNGAASNYNFGDLYTSSATTTRTSNWVGAWWKSATAIFSYKTSQVQSTHSVNPSATRPGIDAVASIRCSYCHDVHELALATGDTKAGKPYLRGTWRGNPYREDGAPHSSVTYQDGERFGRIPRGGIQYTEMGGYQIDQNNGNPTAGWTLSSSAGLCVLCHGSNVNSMNKFDVDEAGAAETADLSWVGTNGHSAAAIGGTGSAAANIFTNSDRGSANPGTGDPDVLNGPMAYQKSNGATGNGFGPGDTDGGSTTAGTRMGSKGGDAGPQGIAPNAKYTDTSEVQHRGTTYFTWGVTVDNATINASYHKFSCSKCHNPHASRLPRLMITNCLDTKHNSWDNGKYKEGTTTYLTPLATYGNNTGKSLSNTTTAQNCHRLGGDDPTDTKDAAGAGSGWNNVTPW